MLVQLSYLTWVYLKQYEFRDRGFVQRCPIDETAVHNYFHLCFTLKLEKFNKKPT